MNDSPLAKVKNDDFAGQIDAVVDSCLRTLSQLSSLRAIQRQEVLALATSGGIAPPKWDAIGSGADDEARLKALQERAQASAAAGPGPVDKSVALEQLHRAAAHATALALYNAVAAQQQLDVIAQAVLAARATRSLASARG